MTRISKNGLVVTDTFNNDADCIILALSCTTNEFSKSNEFNTLADTILLNAMHQLPSTAGEVLGMEIIDNKKFYPECNFIYDAVVKISEDNKEDVEVEFYHHEKLTVGTNYIRIFSKVSSDMQSGALLSFGGTVSKEGEGLIYDTIHEIIDPILNQILVTDPLAVYDHQIPDSVRDFLRNVYKKRFESIGHISYYDRITDTTKEYPLDNEKYMYLAIEQELSKFITNNVLSLQQIINTNEIVYDYLSKNKLYLFGNMIRFSLKNMET